MLETNNLDVTDVGLGNAIRVLTEEPDLLSDVVDALLKPIEEVSWMKRFSVGYKKAKKASKGVASLTHGLAAASWKPGMKEKIKVTKQLRRLRKS